MDLTDPDQPPLPDVAEALRPYLGASRRTAKRAYEFGGVPWGRKRGCFTHPPHALGDRE